MKTHSLISYWYYGWPRLIYATRNWWTHRKETPEIREKRIASNKNQVRKLWEEHKEDVWDKVPESRGVMEMRKELDKLMDEVLGKDDPPTSGKSSIQ